MKFNLKFQLLFLLTLWVIVQGSFIYSHGIIEKGEAEKYISEANTFLTTGKLSSTNYWFYFTQIFVLALSFKTGLGFVFVLTIQLLFSAWATYSFYRLATHLFTPLTALTGTFLLLLNYPFQELNTYLQTESLFSSLTIIISAYMLRLSKCTLWNMAIILILLGLLCITRPNGLLLVPTAAIYLFFRFFNTIGIRMKVAVVVMASIAFLFILNAVIGSKGEWDFLLPYLEEQVICGVPRIKRSIAASTMQDGDSVYSLLSYIVQHFDQFITLAFLKTKSFFGLLRSYYSTGHNILLAVFFYPLYVAVILSTKWWMKNERYWFLYLASTIIIIWGMTMLTCDDWHNRWLLSISPWIILLGLPAITRLLFLLTPSKLK